MAGAARLPCMAESGLPALCNPQGELHALKVWMHAF
jgi:hypothetical protein